MTEPLGERIEALDWDALLTAIDENGFATTGPLLTARECHELSALYDAEDMFRSRVIMARHAFGRGEYKYFARPLPAPIETLRQGVYPHLVPLANAWAAAMRSDVRYPQSHSEMVARCHAAGQSKPTPLLLRYGARDYNCLHQDIYGEHLFPMQLAILLDEPGEDFDGGEFVLTEQRPRMQSRPMVVPLRRGHGVLFAVNDRPQRGKRGYYRVKMRHGVSEVRRGRRHTLGIIFHDAA